MSKTIKVILFPINFVFMACIMLYRWLISPLLPHTCRFYPTCSVYAIKALKEFGVIKGTYFACKRLAKCTPLNKGGFDPLPQNIKGDSKWII